MMVTFPCVNHIRKECLRLGNIHFMFSLFVIINYDYATVVMYMSLLVLVGAYIKVYNIYITPELR